MFPLAAIAFSTALLAAAPAEPVASATGCSTDVFPIDGTSVTLTICPPPAEKGATKTVVTEHFSVKNQPEFVRDVALDRVPGAESSRAIDDVSLERLGLSRSLHLTIALKNGTVRLEHALLIPGAVALK